MARRDELELLAKEIPQRTNQEKGCVHSAAARKEVQKPFNRGSMEGCDAARKMLTTICWMLMNEEEFRITG